MGQRVLPYANEIYLDIYRESLLERSTLFPTCFIVASVHVVREGNLLVVPRRKQANLRPSKPSPDPQM